MKQKLLAAAFTSLMGVTGFVVADTIYVDLGTNLNASDADTRTNDFSDLGLFPDATSVYTSTKVGDLPNILEAGETFTFTDAGEVQIASLVPLITPANTENFLFDWELRAEYLISGDAVYVGPDLDLTTVTQGQEFAAGTGVLPTFLSGVLNIYLKDLDGAILGTIGDETQVLQLRLVPPVPGALVGNIVLDGVLDWTWYTAPGGPVLPGTEDWIIQNGFNFAGGGGSSFYQLGAIDIADIFWRVDFNLDPALIPFNQSGDGNVDPTILGTAPDCAEGTLCRTANLNMTLKFSPVPVPGTLALFGLGLLGLGASKLRKKEVGSRVV